MENDFELNAHNKEEFPPAHTAEHLLNQTMIRMFGCERSTNAHIERKKSKISYILDHKPSRHEEKEIEKRMNELIDEDLPVTFEFVTRDNIPDDVSLDRLPDDASETIRLVRPTGTKRSVRSGYVIRLCSKTKQRKEASCTLRGLSSNIIYPSNTDLI